MAAVLMGENLWIHCLNSDGVFKIALPKIAKTGYKSYEVLHPGHPDSSQMVMNNHGDLLIMI